MWEEKAITLMLSVPDGFTELISEGWQEYILGSNDGVRRMEICSFRLKKVLLLKDSEQDA